MPDEETGESFESFRRSFSYGSRSDLSFKFLAGLSDDDAADFLQALLWRLGDTLDDGDSARLADHVIAGQARAYGRPSRWAYDDGPFARPAAPLAELRLGLLTSSGHFVDGDDPLPFGVAGMTQEDAQRRIGEFTRSEPTLSAIPFDTPPADLRVRHGGYDVRGAERDPEVILPLATLRGLERDGVVGALAPEAYSFVGATAQARLLEHAGPEWVAALREQGIGGLLLVPA